jgi:hypothetical protein
LSPTAFELAHSLFIKKNGHLFRTHLHETFSRVPNRKLSQAELAELRLALAAFANEAPAQEILPPNDIPAPTCKGTRHVTYLRRGWFSMHKVTILDWWDWEGEGRPRWLELISDLSV